MQDHAFTPTIPLFFNADQSQTKVFGPDLDRIRELLATQWCQETMQTRIDESGMQTDELTRFAVDRLPDGSIELNNGDIKITLSPNDERKAEWIH